MDTATKKLYQIQYNDHKVTYAAERLDSVAARYGYYGELRDADRLAIATHLYCDTHFMSSSAARRREYDAGTRGDVWQSWTYEPYGVFKGWIHAQTTLKIKKIMEQKIDMEALRRQIRSEFARQGGKAKSATKAAAARENGKKGGRPKSSARSDARISC